MSDTIMNFLRYPGSKRHMLNFLGEHIKEAYDRQRRYVEPFVGGGAVFFMLEPEHAVLSDVNPDLIDLYRGIQHSPESVWRRYCSFGSSRSDYHRIRDTYQPESLTDRAARILFLNRTCFKGMWRHNQEGKFNVGYGGQDRRWVIDLEDLRAVSYALRNVELRCCDFQDVLEACEPGDFVFADPPYQPGERELTNDHYTGESFKFADHRRLATALRDAKENGIDWALTTSAHQDIVSLFEDNRIIKIPRGTGRRPGITVKNSKEVLITSYQMNGG